MKIEKMIVGCLVTHPKYGTGTVIGQGMGTVEVEFEESEQVLSFPEQDNPLSFY